MTDERIDALIARLDVPSPPDPAFVEATARILRPRVRAARGQDLTRLGRTRRDLRLAFGADPWPSIPQPVAAFLLVAILVLAAIAVAVVVAGALVRPVPLANGPLIVSVEGGLRSVNVDTGAVSVLGPPGEPINHVSRSPDGRLIASWRSSTAGDTLMVSPATGAGPHRRALTTQPGLMWAGCIDTWSPDSRSIATEVVTGGVHRILVVDATNVASRFVTPAGVGGHCPLWSPDGLAIAFAEDRPDGSRVLAVVDLAGGAPRVISGDLGGGRVSGPDTWSPDGAWIYFDAVEGTSVHVYRASPVLGTSVQLTSNDLVAAGPASSPDGSRIVFNVTAAVGWDLWIAASDGTDPHRLLERATNSGWSADGSWVLARWTPPDQTGGLAVVSPDGIDRAFRLLVPFQDGCPADPAKDCLRDLGWGQPRP